MGLGLARLSLRPTFRSIRSRLFSNFGQTRGIGLVVRRCRSSQPRFSSLRLLVVDHRGLPVSSAKICAGPEYGYEECHRPSEKR